MFMRRKEVEKSVIDTFDANKVADNTTSERRWRQWSKLLFVFLMFYCHTLLQLSLSRDLFVVTSTLSIVDIAV